MEVRLAESLNNGDLKKYSNINLLFHRYFFSPSLFFHPRLLLSIKPPFLFNFRTWVSKCRGFSYGGRGSTGIRSASIIMGLNSGESGIQFGARNISAFCVCLFRILFDLCRLLPNSFEGNWWSNSVEFLFSFFFIFFS